MKRVIFIVVTAAVLAALSRPPRKPMRDCPHCGAGNEPENTRCVTCLRPI